MLPLPERKAVSHCVPNGLGRSVIPRQSVRGILPESLPTFYAKHKIETPIVESNVPGIAREAVSFPMIPEKPSLPQRAGFACKGRGVRSSDTQ